MEKNKKTKKRIDIPFQGKPCKLIETNNQKVHQIMIKPNLNKMDPTGMKFPHLKSGTQYGIDEHKDYFINKSNKIVIDKKIIKRKVK